MAKKKPYRFVLYLCLRFLAACIALIPRRCALAIARGLGRLGFYAVSRQRAKVLKHLHVAFEGEKSDAEIRQIAVQVFENCVQTGVELLRFPRFTDERIREIVDFGKTREISEALLGEGNGLLVITAHIGNWELLAGAFSTLSFKSKVIARELYYEPYNRWLVGLREAVGVETIYRSGASREALKWLQTNQTLGMLPDQDIDSLRGVFVNFFGTEAYTPIAPVRMAMACKSPILPAFLIRGEKGQYKIVLKEVIRPTGDTKDSQAIENYTRQWMNAFEAVIREYPGQWAWMHDRWKTKRK